MMNQATVLNPERNDDILGEGWSWSTRHEQKVVSGDYWMHVRRGKLVMKSKGNQSRTVVYDIGAYPVMKMIVLTHFASDGEMYQYING